MHRFAKVLENGDDFFPLRVLGGTAVVVLALVSAVANGIDSTVLLLAAAGVLLFTLPWARLSSLKAGPLEFSLAQGQVRGAIDSIVNVGGSETDKIEDLLTRLSADIERARGSRILWVDDRPRRVSAERRLLRSLEIESEIVPTCAAAADVLTVDNDFDLVVTSLEKSRERSFLKNSLRNPGVVFVEWLRGKDDPEIRSLIGSCEEVPVRDTVINRLPVIFYAAFPTLAQIQQSLKPLIDLEPAPEAANSLDGMLKKTIRTLSDSRSNPIEVNAAKKVSAS